MYNKFTIDTVLELLEKEILKFGNYLITDHYLVVSARIMDQVYRYLYDSGYTSTMEIKSYHGEEELGLIEINR